MSETARQHVPATGRTLMVISVAVFAVMAIATALEDWPTSLGSATWPAALAVLAFVAGVRPAVWVEGDRVAVRGMASTLWIPAAAIKTVAVQQTLILRVGDRRIRSAAVGRRVRQVAQEALKRPCSRLEPDPPKQRLDAAALAEDLIRNAAQGARVLRGWDVYDDEVHQLGNDVRREWSWPVVALLVVSLGAPIATTFL